jgi:tetratricopeptide (TPR) repeat protein
MEFLIVLAFFGYIYYLRNYADLRTKSEKEMDAVSDGIALFENQKLDEAFRYFDQRVREKPKSAIAYLYRGLCKKQLNDQSEALKDLQTAISLDDQVYQIQLQLGKLYLECEQHDRALYALAKAIELNDHQDPEAYHWRAQAYLRLNRQDEAWQDFEAERIAAEKQASNRFAPSGSKTHFVDRRLIASMVMVVFTSVLIVSVVRNAESVHLPYLVAVFSSISIGFAEPRKGWLLAIVQSVLILSGYLLFVKTPDKSGQRELENFALYGSIVLTFAASFLGGFLKRALNMK